MFVGKPRVASGLWPRLISATLVMLGLLPTVVRAAAPSSKTFDVVGIVDCGRASGQRCEFGDTLRIRTTDITGRLQVFEIDISWLKDLPALDQDDQIFLELEEKPGGGYQGLRFVTPDKPKSANKPEEDDVKAQQGRSQVPLLAIDDVVVRQGFQQGEQDGLLLTRSPLGIPISPKDAIATFTVTLSAATEEMVTVQYATRDGTALGRSSCDEDGADYITTSGTLTFNPGQTVKTVDVAICPYSNDFDFDDEQFFVDLSNPKNATIKDPQGVGTILLPEA